MRPFERWQTVVRDVSQPARAERRRRARNSRRVYIVSRIAIESGARVRQRMYQLPHAASDSRRHSALGFDRPSHPPSAGSSWERSASDSEIVVWQDPPSQVRERDLAVASLVIGAKRGLTALRDQGVKLIEALPQEVKDNDPAILSSLVSIRMQRREPEKALAAARRALEVQPDSGFASLSLAIALQNSGDEAVAERQFLHTIDLDPSLDAAWTNLAFLYDRQGRKADRIALLDRYLKWNPQSIWFHQLKTMTR